MVWTACKRLVGPKSRFQDLRICVVSTNRIPLETTQSTNSRMGLPLWYRSFGGAQQAGHWPRCRRGFFPRGFPTAQARRTGPRSRSGARARRCWTRSSRRKERPRGGGGRGGGERAGGGGGGGDEGKRGRGEEGKRGRGEEGKRGRGEEGKRGRGEEGKRGRGEEGKRGRGEEGKRGRGGGGAKYSYLRKCVPGPALGEGAVLSFSQILAFKVGNPKQTNLGNHVYEPCSRSDQPGNHRGTGSCANEALHGVVRISGLILFGP